MRAPLAEASSKGIKEALGLLFKRKQKSLDRVDLPTMPLLEQELQHHVLNNGRSIELVEELENNPIDVGIEELRDILLVAPLSGALRNWIK